MLKWKQMLLIFTISLSFITNQAVARFVSADPVTAQQHLKKGNVQGFNRYAYANNNPYKYTDPDGRNPVAGAALGCAMTGPACPVGAVVGGVIGATLGVLGVIAYNELTDDSSVDGKKKEKAKDRRKKQKDKAKEEKFGEAGEPASEDYVNSKAKNKEKRDGKQGRRDSHDKKQKGEPDRTKEQIDEDYQ